MSANSSRLAVVLVNLGLTSHANTCAGKTVSYESLRPPAGRFATTGNNGGLVKKRVRVHVCLLLTVEMQKSSVFFSVKKKV